MANTGFLKRSLLIIIGGGLLIGATPFFVHAYEPATTHAALTDEVVDFFNLSYPAMALTAEEKEAVVEGSIREDDDLRMMRHFYDPVYNRGLTIGGKEWEASRVWSQDTLAQAGAVGGFVASTFTSLYSGEGDYSWERAVYEYAWGDKEYALEALGHVLHLIEDASVPDHTRNDPHPPILHEGSPYEAWTNKIDRETIDVLSKVQNRKPTIFSDLNSYFESMAKYSNGNFFSKDTAPDKSGYPSPQVQKYHQGIGYGKDSSGNQYPIIRKIIEIDGSITYTLTAKHDLVLSNYWHLLSQQAVLHGAGVVKLFFDEVENEKGSKTLYTKNRSWWGKVVDAAKEKVYNAAGVLYGASVPYDEVRRLNDDPLAPSEPTAPLRAASAIGAEPQPTPPAPTSDSVPTETVLEPTEPQALLDGAPSPLATVPDTALPARIPDPMALPHSYSPGFGGGAGARAAVSVEEPSAELGSGTEEPDDEEDTSEDEHEEPPHDTQAPDLTAAGACDESLASDGCLLYETSRDFSWSSTAEDLAWYMTESGGVWATTTATSTQIAGLNAGAHIFAVAAYDTAGNASATTTFIWTVATLPVVINEVAWAGTAASASDEWIELYNRTAHTIPLAGWALIADDGVPYIPLEGSIAAGDYYLIERGDDEVVSDIAADLVAPFSGTGGGSGISNDGEGLSLVYLSDGATTTVDAFTRCGNWCGIGSASTRRTAERFDASISGTSTGNWATSLGEFIVYGADADGNDLAGTPGHKNSVSYQILAGSNLTADTTLTKAGSPYIIPRSGITIASGATLTLEAGAVVKIVAPSEPQIIVNGAIKALGTADEPVVFTAFADDTYGGDTNGDGTCDSANASSTAACPYAGAWRRILINTSSIGSRFEHAHIRYGGMDVFAQSLTAALSVDGADVAMDHLTITSSKVNGLYLKASKSSITHSIFSENGTSTAKSGVVVDASNATLEENTFDKNGVGLTVSGAAGATIRTNTFTNNSGTAVSASLTGAILSGTTGSGNGTNAIVISGSTASPSDGVATTTLAANTLPYRLSGTVTVASSTALAFDDGVTLQGAANTALSVSKGGFLYHNGADTSSLTLTSRYDDGGATAPAEGDWYGIEVAEGGSLSLKGFTLRYAGGKTGGGGVVFASGAGTSTLATGIISDNTRAGIRAASGSILSLSDLTIARHDDNNPEGNAIHLVGAIMEAINIVFDGNRIDLRATGSASTTCALCLRADGSQIVTDPSDLIY